jgi:hypothetical protein
VTGGAVVGPKPSPRRSLNPEFVAAVRVRGVSLRSLGTIAGYPCRCQLSYVLRHAVPVNAITVARLTKLAEHICYIGPIFVEASL